MRAGADAVIAEGQESGGHIGRSNQYGLTARRVDAVAVPVIAAGGLADGRGLLAALAMGAAGIQMGTRFICTDDCIAHLNYKHAIIAANERSTMVTGAFYRPSSALPTQPHVATISRRWKNAANTDREIIEFGTGRFAHGRSRG